MLAFKLRVPISDPEALYVYVTDNPAPGVKKHKFMCTVCGRTGLSRRDVRNHVESFHFPNLFTYNCPICGMQMKTKKALNGHKYTYHRERQREELTSLADESI